MSDRPGLRERKKQRTREAISAAAISMFLDAGFDQVSVAQVADAAEVSKRTLFAYFPTKEDLVLHRFADHETESGRVIRLRAARQSPLTALRDHFVDGLNRRDPITGLNDEPQVLALYKMVLETPALAARLLQFNARSFEAVAAALADTTAVTGTAARLAAAQIVGVIWTLATDNATALAGGMTADARLPEASAAADLGFAMLRGGVKLGP
ncbi:TetR/AcrR family transcriptional regulator [Amycolatopsis xylanica]|nr:TetR family transcriptional regulator [Amycolatopsis xylanica]